MIDWLAIHYNRLVADYNALNEEKKAPHEVQHVDWSKVLADSSKLVSVGVDQHPTDEELNKIAEHNRALCDQVITVTRLENGALVLEYGTQDGLKFLAKNYPRMCLLEDSSHFAPGVPRYLLVYAQAQNDFTGFQPVQQTTNSAISGRGILTNAYGSQWNFTYTGTLQTTERVETPYSINSQSIFLNAYDENGLVVSQRSITQIESNRRRRAYAAGYNAGNLIFCYGTSPAAGCEGSPGCTEDSKYPTK